MESIKIMKCLKALSPYSPHELKSIEGNYLERHKKINFGNLEEVVIGLKELEEKVENIIRRLGNAGKVSKSIRLEGGLSQSKKGADSSTYEDDEEPCGSPNTTMNETLKSSSESSVESSEERKLFLVRVDVTNFPVEKIAVKVFHNRLLIHAEHKMKPDHHGFISREFTREFEIPEEVDISTFRSLIDCYGVLMVQASYKPKDVETPTPLMLVDPYGKTSFQPYEVIGEQFQELANHHIKDAKEMDNFATKLAKQRPSDYIPYENVF